MKAIFFTLITIASLNIFASETEINLISKIKNLDAKLKSSSENCFMLGDEFSFTSLAASGLVVESINSMGSKYFISYQVNIENHPELNFHFTCQR